MKIQSHPPYVRRGVTQLMYVGDDEAVEKSTAPDWGKILKYGAIGWVAMWILAGISPPKSKR